MAKQLTKYIGNTPTSHSLIDGMLYSRVYATTAQDNELTFSLRGLWESTIAGKLHSTSAWTDYQQSAIYKVLENFTDILDISFTEISNPDLADFDIGMADPSKDNSVDWNSSDGYAYLPSSYMAQYNDVRFDSHYMAQDGMLEGSRSFNIMLQKMGQALGLLHPQQATNDEFAIAGDNQAAGTAGLNDGRYTMMSFRTPSELQSASLMALDIAALQSQYGMADKNTADTTYNLEDVLDKSYKCIWDTGGTDTLKYGGTANVVIDLRSAHLDLGAASIAGEGTVSNGYNGAAGYFSGFYDGNQYDDNGSELKGGYYIANGVTIENAIGGSGNDRLIGNSASNILSGGSGNDTLIVQDDGNDTLIGGNGNDKYIVTISATHNGNITIDNYAATNGYDELTLNFSAAQLLAMNILKVGNDLVTYLDTDSSLRFQNWFWGGLYQLDKIILTDGSYTAQEFQNTFWDAPTDDDYTFTKGDGDLIISDNGGEDSLKLTNVNIKDVTFARDGNNLTITVIATGEMITIQNHYGEGKMEKFYFKDATTNAAEMEYILKGAILGTDGRERTKTTINDDIVIGFKGNDEHFFHQGKKPQTDTVVLSQDFGFDWVVLYYEDNNAYKDKSAIDKINFVFTDMLSTDFTYTFSTAYSGVRLNLISNLNSNDHLVIGNFNGNYQNTITIEFQDKKLVYKDLIAKTEGKGIFIGTDKDEIYDSTISPDQYTYFLNGGNDKLIVDHLVSHIYGGEGNDHIIFTSNASTDRYTKIYGEEGDDIIDLRGSKAEDMHIYGGEGNDIIYGSASTTSGYAIYSNDGNDTIYGYGARGSISSGAGYNKIYSGAGDEIISIRGNEDRIFYDLGDGNDSVSNFSDFSSITFNNLASTDVSIFTLPHRSSSSILEQVIFIKETGESILVDAQLFHEYIFTDGTFYQQEDGSLNLGKTFSSNTSNISTSNDDYLTGSAINGLDGDDIIVLLSSGEAYAGNGNDSILGSSYKDVIYGDDGDDIVSALRGDDQLYGGAGNDVLNGGLNNDILTGGTGDDRLYGGFDNDTFIYGLGDGNDIISDKHGFDILSLTDISFNEVAMTEEGDNMVLHMLGSGETITIFGQFDAPNLYEKEGETTIDRFDFMDGSFTADEIMDLFMGPPPPPMFA